MIKYLWIMTIVTLLVPGCGVKPDAKSGNDYTKSMALPVNIGATVDDKVDAKKGDSTDWKRFKVEDPGPLKINVYWDSPDNIDATLELRTNIGVKIATLRHKHKKKSPKDTISKKNIGPGAYFSKIHADKGASVYTVEVLTGALTSGSTYGVPRPE